MIIRALYIILVSISLYAGIIPGASLTVDKGVNAIDALPDGNAPDYNLTQYTEGLSEKKIIQKNFDEGNGFTFTMDENGSFATTGELNLTRPSNLKEFFKYRSSGNNAAVVINKSGEKTTASQDIFGTDPSRFTRAYLLETHPDSNESNYTKRAENLAIMLKARTAKGRYIKCYAKRRLLPQFYCPIPGMEQGSRIGGMPEDDSSSTKEYCDEYCISSNSYGCRSAETGLQSEVSIGEAHTFGWERDNKTFSIVIDIESRLKLKSISYERTTEISETTNQHDFKRAPMIMRYRLEYLDPQDNWQHIVTNYPIAMEEGFERVTLSAIPEAKQVKITFFHPYLEKDDIYKNRRGEEFLKKITLENFRVHYYSDKYYFCNIDQVVLDIQEECQGGKIYDMSDDSGTFKVCVQKNGIRGPEKTYNAFFTQSNCNQACRVRMECVQTYDRYSFTEATDSNAYAIDVGCVDEPSNANCSPQMCKELFRDHRLPNSEIVYSPDNGSRMTVVSGSEIPGSRRPKVDIDGEESAIASGDYDDVFTESMKDVAYENMIKKGTYNFVSTTIEENTREQFAYERVIMENESPYKPPRIAINWLYKPKAWDVGDNRRFKLYVLAKIEIIYKPSSGTFYLEGGYETTYDPKYFPFFKDEVYAYRREDGVFEPFYIREYAYIQDANLTDYEWKSNAQHINERYIRYYMDGDEYLSASATEPLKYFKMTAFSGGSNWETYRVVDDIIDDFSKGYHGLRFIRQEVNGYTQLPIKRWQGEIDNNSSSTLGRVQLYGLVFPASASIDFNKGKEAIEGKESIKATLFYDTAAYQRLSKTIDGDGAIKNNAVKLFVKGSPEKTSVSVELKPSVRDEGKDAILFMYLYKKD